MRNAANTRLVADQPLRQIGEPPILKAISRTRPFHVDTQRKRTSLSDIGIVWKTRVEAEGASVGSDAGKIRHLLTPMFRSFLTCLPHAVARRLRLCKVESNKP